MAGKHTLEGKNGIIALRLLADVCSILDQGGVPYWLEGGTLLGIVREDRLLPWDNDLDISIGAEDSEALLALLPRLRHRGYRVRQRFFAEDAPLCAGQLRLIKVRNRRLFFFRGEVCLDIFIKYRRGENRCWGIGNRIKEVPAHYYDRLAPWMFQGRDYQVPRDYEGYLSYRYGDWRTPRREWNTFRDDAALQGRDQG